MFKRLRERIAEEATRFPVGQLSNNSGKQFTDSENKPATANSTEDLITLSDSSAVVVPHTSSQQFSIGEDEDGSLSEQNTPQRKQTISSDHPELYSSPNLPKEHPGNVSDINFCPEYRPTKSSYVPQSDIESEREEPPTLNLDGISKEQLMAIIQALKAKSYKYKNKYAEVVKNFKELRDEKMKIENTLIENQDKGLRRIAELREQCQLEQKAKAHLEANLRLMLEEKDSRISVLETQINLLKESEKSSNVLIEDGQVQISELSSGDSQSESSTTSLNQDSSVFQEKLERLEHQYKQAKKTITSQTDQISLLRKQNESLSQELEEKVKRLNYLEDDQEKLKSEHESILKSMQIRLEELEAQQEESVMSMAETKRNMHEELELKEKQLTKVEEDSRQYQAAAEHEKALVILLKQQHEEKINELQRQLESTEKALEEEKKNLMQELTRGKTAAVTLMQQECAKKVSAVEEEWKSKLQELQLENEKVVESKVKDLSTWLVDTEEKLKSAEIRTAELNSAVVQLEKENASLKNMVEKQETESNETRHDESLKCMKEKLDNAEKNYKTQMNGIKLRISQLEKENAALEAEKEELLKIQSKFSELERVENSMKLELKSREDEIQQLQQKYENSSKEQVGKIYNLQETLKDKENCILKLKANIEFVTNDNLEKFEELNKKIKVLEVERETLMLQAQERVSATEAKCRENVKHLQETNSKLLLEIKESEKLKTKIAVLSNQLDESLLVAETNQAAASHEISKLKEQLLQSECALSEMEEVKKNSEKCLMEKVEKLQEANENLLGKSDHVEKLKSEKEGLNEKLKLVEQQLTVVRQLEEERDSLKTENESFLKELNVLRTLQEEMVEFQTKNKSLEETENFLRNELESLKDVNRKLEFEISMLKGSLNSETNSLKSENEKLLKRISLLEKFDSSDPQSTAVKEYIAMLKGECETAIKANEAEMDHKLKQLVRDFGIQMDVKDNSCDKIISEMMEKNQDVEERLEKEHRIELAALRQDLFEKDCALEEMQEHYQETLIERDKKIKELELTVKQLSPNSSVPCDSMHIPAESSDWDDTWVMPDEAVENPSPAHSDKNCSEHLHQIETLQEELSKSNSEIKELKILLRLSPPESMINNNTCRDSLHSIPEPTEFEYLKNIIYEYMMGKEPITLAKVIAAVLRFSDVQTQQVLRREEARHPTK